MFGNPQQDDQRLGVINLKDLKPDASCKAERSPMDPLKWHITVPAKDHPGLKPTSGLTVDTREIMFDEDDGPPQGTVAHALELGFTTAYLVRDE